MPRALIITAAGINCDLELARAFELAGARAERVHLNDLIAQPEMIESFDLIGVPGGFSFGDAIAAGRVMAALMRKHLYEVFIRAIERQTPIFAPCNGFQILAQTGLLPGPDDGEAWPTAPPRPTISLAQNAGGRFADVWSRVEFPKSRCIWTRGFDEIDADERVMMLPSAHGEGRFVVDDPSVIARLEANHQIVMRYHPDDNFNGSMHRIAGVCDASGLVFGLMPHPERFARWEQHPFWTRLDEETREGETIGLRMFRSAVEFVNQKSRRRGECDQGAAGSFHTLTA